MHKRGRCRCVVSVRPSVTLVHCVETSKHILKLVWQTINILGQYVHGFSLVWEYHVYIYKSFCQIIHFTQKQSYKKANNNNNDNKDNVYGAVNMAEPLQEFTQFI